MKEKKKEKKIKFKVCVYCGSIFVRKADESRQRFNQRKKCHAKCIRETDAATNVATFRVNSKGAASDFGIAECHMFTRSWFTQNAHWRKHY